ncbi:MAG: tRNA pseudouridine(13) synthase TruD [Phycisphaerae bacterium]|nr:tRNA pseudouridine(13) synthase TruD [Phycisphaerae bacterium]
MSNSLMVPFLTREVPGVPGVVKERREDFFVEEVPLYEPSGQGTHVYLTIEKRGIPTMEATRQIARALSVAQHQIGYAGLKDARAVTRQTFSVEHVDLERVIGLELPNIRVMSVSRHGNKLRIGHLKGNRFVIRMRRTDPKRLADVRAVLEVLARRGLPNAFGPQRFGERGDTWQVGQAMLRQDWDECVDVLLGRPGPSDYGGILEARQLYELGRYAEAAEAWPWAFRMEKRACRALAKAGGSKARAFKAIDKQIKRFYISAYQSRLFNRVVAERIDELDRLWLGDLAYRHPQGSVFTVEDPACEQPRCDAMEISPSGPIFGYRMSQPTGKAGEMESAVLAEDGFALEDFRSAAVYRIKGARRALRVPIGEVAAEAGADEHGEFIKLRFFLPAGSYALSVVREICKTDVGDEDGSEE